MAWLVLVAVAYAGLAAYPLMPVPDQVPVVIQATLGLGATLLTAAGLGFLGFESARGGPVDGARVPVVAAHPPGLGRGREAQWRPCRLEAKRLKEAAQWVGHYRRFWEESFDRLDDYLNEFQKREKKHGPKN